MLSLAVNEIRPSFADDNERRDNIMDMKTFRAKFNVDGRPCGEIIVTARDSSMAKKMAQAELQGRAGFAGKKIVVTGVVKI